MNYEITSENLISALLFEPTNIGKVPLHLFTADNVERIINAFDSKLTNASLFIFRYLATKHASSITYESWMKMVKHFYSCLPYIPEPFRTTEMYNTAIQGFGYAYIYIPDDVKTVEQTMLALRSSSSPEYISCIPPKFLAITEVENEVVDTCMCHVYTKLKTDLVRMLSLENQHKLVSYIPEYCPEVDPRIVEYENWVAYTETNFPDLRKIPPEYHTEEIMLNCIRGEESNFIDVREEFKTPEFLLKIIQVNFEAYTSFNDKDKTYEVSLAFFFRMKKARDGDLKEWISYIPLECMRDELKVLCDEILN